MRHTVQRSLRPPLSLIHISKSLAKELASRNVTVNAVAPGFIATDMTAALPEAVRTEMCKTIPEGHAGQPEDVANAVAFFAAEQDRKSTRLNSSH